MTSRDFLDLVKENGDYKTLTTAKTAVDAFTAAVTVAVEKGEDVSLIGFGSFKTAIRKGKTGSIPNSGGKTYTTVDKQIVKFTAGKNLRDTAAGKQL